MKIRLIQINDQQIDKTIRSHFKLRNDLVPKSTKTAIYQLSNVPDKVQSLLRSSTFTNYMFHDDSQRILYHCDLMQLDTFLKKERDKDLSEEYHFLNELRLKANSLDYSHPESEKMFGIDLSKPRIMGVLNVTPDSFSDGGKFDTCEKAVVQAMKLIEDGADILDIGGESSRPGATPVPEDVELDRVIPVIQKIRKQSDITISIDTYKANVAKKGLDVGASWINDITGLRHDPGMVSVAKNWQCPVIVMHMLGMPQLMQKNPQYDNVIADVLDYFDERISHLKDNKINKIILDPGIGFGKRLEHNMALLNQIKLFKQFGYPVMVGTSNKSFIGQITGKEVNDREAGTIASIVWSAINNVSIVRVHKVSDAKDSLKIINQIL